MPHSVTLPRVFPKRNGKPRQKQVDKRASRRRKCIREHNLRDGSIIKLPREKHGRTIAAVDLETGFVKLRGEGNKRFCPLSFVW